MSCCYLLRSLASPSRSYIGYTVDPAARIKRHNGIGGAKATQRHRPWEYVCVVSGFTSQTAAKCFEFAWQQPRTPWRTMQRVLQLKGLIHAHASYTALKGLTTDLVKDSDGVLWHLRVLAVMLSMDVWKGLSVRFATVADKERARVHPGVQQPLAIERSAVEALPAAAAPRAGAALLAGQAGAPRARAAILRVPAAPAQGGKKRAREAEGKGDCDEIEIVVDD